MTRYSAEIAQRHRELAMEYDIEARTAARARGLNPLDSRYIEQAFTWLANRAALDRASLEARVSELEALVPRPGLAVAVDAGRSVCDQEPAPPSATRSEIGREAQSHHASSRAWGSGQ